MVNFKLHLYLPSRVGVGWWVWIVIINIKASLRLTGTGLPAETELGKICNPFINQKYLHSVYMVHVTQNSQLKFMDSTQKLVLRI